MGVRLADDAVMVSYIPTDGAGAVIDRSAAYWEDFLIMSTLLSIITVMLAGMVWVIQRLGGRKVARLAQRARQA